jgi:glutathione-regulated potassium-efflux system ancillary protein KefC/glutathione-regulated potassium-efflux system protein KefB
LFYGDASHLDLLRAAGIERARALVIAVDNVETSVKIATIVKASFPGLPIYARVRNRQHAYKMLDLGVTLMERETYHSSLRLCERLLTDLDGDGDHAREVIKTFQAWDEALLAKGYLVHQDEAQMVQNAKQAMAELGQIFEAEAERRRHPAPSTAPESAARS